MALESVDIHIQTDDLVPVGIQNVVIRVFDETGTTLITTALTDVSGDAALTLDGDDPAITYQLRFYKSGGTFTVTMIDVYSPASAAPSLTNAFEITGHLHTMPEATDPLFCRLSGYIVLPDGRPARGVRVHWIFRGRPQMADERGVLGERVTTITDATGFMQVDLIRGGCYLATVAFDSDTQRDITVPDVAGVNLMKVLYPLVALLEWTPPTTMTVGDTAILYPVVKTSAGVTLEGAAPGDIEYAADDPDILGVCVTETSVTLTALAAGTTTLRATRKDTSIAYVPDTEITDGSIVINIS